MTVVMCSMWRNDAGRDLRRRAEHLLSKRGPGLRWVWVVGDSEDATHTRLQEYIDEIKPPGRVDLIVGHTHIPGDNYSARLRRLGATANFWLAEVQPADEYVLIHESDIISPPDIVERFLAHAAAGRCPIAGWPVLPLGPNGETVFYDIWGYRKDGALFTNTPPYHACYRPDEPFEVDSVGSVWLFHAEDVRAGVYFDQNASVGLCAQLRDRGRRIWVDPTLTVVQPRELWTPHSMHD